MDTQQSLIRMSDELAEDVAEMLLAIEANYQREGSGPGSRFEGQRLEMIQARAVIRCIWEAGITVLRITGAEAWPWS